MKDEFVVQQVTSDYSPSTAGFDSVQLDLQRFEASNEIVHLPLGCLISNGHFWIAFENCLECDLRFETRECHAQAEVDTVAERHVFRRFAAHIELVRLLICGRIPIGCGYRDGEQLVLTDLLAEKFEILHRRSRHPLHGWIKAQHLLYSTWDQRRISTELFVFTGVRQQGVETVADEAGGGFMACREQQRAGRVNLFGAQNVTFLFGGDELTNQVLPGCASFSLDDTLQILDQMRAGYTITIEMPEGAEL